LKNALRVLLALTLVLPCFGQVEDDLHPDAYMEIIKKKANSGEALQAQVKLLAAVTAPKKRAKLIPQVKGLYDMSKAKSRVYIQATCGGILLVLEPGYVTADAVSRLLNGDDDQRLRWLNLAADLEPIDAIHEKLPEVLAKCGPKAKPRVQRVFDAWVSAKQGSGLGTFFALIALCLVAGAGYTVKLATTVDPLKLTLVKYIEESPERERIIRDLKVREAGDEEQKIEAEGPMAPRLVPYLEKFYTPNEVATVLELLSHWDVPEVHEKLKLYATATVDLVKTAAIAAMANMKGDEWNQELVKLLEDGDEIQSAAAARALAERQATDEVPRIQRLFENAGGSLREAYKDALERLAPRG
jgi:hypothetical protein